MTDAAKELVAEEGWDPAYGARPLKRAIQRLLENPLALELLEGRFAEGDVVRVDAADGELDVRPRRSSLARRGVVPNGHLAARPRAEDHPRVWRRPEPALDRETVDGIIRKLMAIDTKLDRSARTVGDRR